MEHRKFDQALSEVHLFKALSDTERAEIAGKCTWHRLEARKTVIGHQDGSTEVYFVVQGRLRAINYSLNGKEVSFRDILPGETFGELAAIDGGERSANVFTLEDSFVGALSAALFADVLARYPPVASVLLQQLTGQIRSLTERIFEFSTLAVNNRIHAEILRLALAAGVSDNISKISAVPTHAEIASRVSTHREAVTRELNELTRMGLLEKDGRTLTVTDFGKLQALVAMELGEFAVTLPEDGR